MRVVVDTTSLVVRLLDELIHSLKNVFSKEGLVFLRDGLDSVLLLIGVAAGVLLVVEAYFAEFSLFVVIPVGVDEEL